MYKITADSIQSRPRPGSLDAVLALLDQMTPLQRLRASRHGDFSRLERTIWAAHFPEEVPLINGELEWIALSLGDLD